MKWETRARKDYEKEHEDSVIKRHMIEDAYKDGVIKLDIKMGDIAAIIGEHWFWFDTSDDFVIESVEQYKKKSMPEDVIVDWIFDTVDDMRKREWMLDEYWYYYSYLTEKGYDE